MPSIAIIGSGFGGIGMAASLKADGHDDIVVFEKGDGVGGVWRENEYPGAECDVPSHLYSFSFAPNPDWSRRFAGQREILDYLERCADDLDVRRHIRFGVEVLSATFDDAAGQWVLDLAGGETHRADVLVAATGQLSRPSYPRIDGIDAFDGAVFHSATWDHDYDLRGRRVAVIGTGASAVQFVPHVAQRAASLTLFQRSAPHVLPKPDYPYSPRAVRAFRTVPGLLRASRWATYATLEPRALAFMGFDRLIKPYERRYLRMLKRQVADAELRAKLAPDDPMGCKRILMSNDYYPALTRENVDVVTEPISRVEPGGVVTDDGVLHEVDAIILGTGFAATEFLAPMSVIGAGGVDINDAWRGGAHAYLGLSVSGFPNFFMLYGPNTNLSHNSIVYMLESQFSYVSSAVAALVRTGARAMSVRADVESEFNDTLQKRLAKTVWARGCHGWYTTADGKNTQNWPGFTFAYRRATRTFDPALHDVS
ncbi:flavin-binding monooxygenase [Gordonia spumicola]|uniref:Flavin-binding monooxygenase n=1 Tax=Gordonia spumicola TaxID=589161 RepID=A0A7I9VEZ9_9ACTN|nr:NAD(P)/FAD-dependent oxidoreductase [Gordonia spumicola]GEE03792.1 flavin-binding monooxygenase [Gordonia spumicola]